MTPESTSAVKAASGGPGSSPVLRLDGLSKAFGGAHALRGVGLEIRRNEVHGLLGHNGSGKSTLIKVLAGVYTPDEGTLEMYGEPIDLPLAPGQYRDLGLSFVHQDLGLISDLTVLENLMAAETLARPAYEKISQRQLRERARDLLGEFGIDVDVDALIGDISATDRARVAIVRAVDEIRNDDEEGRYGLLVLDEPTVFLPQSGVEELFALLRQIVELHASVLFVSHDLDEVKEVTDRVTVLVDGDLRATVETASVSTQELVELIVGEALPEGGAAGAAPADHTPKGGAVHVRNLRTPTIDDVSFDVMQGEILGVTGLPGSGYDDLLYTLFGAGIDASGEMRQGDRTYDLSRLTPADAVAARIGLVPADRPNLGGVQDLMLYENMMLPVLGAFRGNLGSLSHRALRRRADHLLDEFGVRARGAEQSLASLSGGNQQKVIVAKWLELEPRLLLLHEPTQGVDVGARREIEEMLIALAADGLPILCAGSDTGELAEMCQRVLVFSRGSIVAEVSGSKLTKDGLVHHVYGAAA